LLHDYRSVWQTGLLAVPGYCHQTAPLFLFGYCQTTLFVVTLGCWQFPLQSSLVLLLPDNWAQTQKNIKLPVRDDVNLLPTKAVASNSAEKWM